MSQNTSHAVMAQRRDHAREAPDDFPTMPWGGRALCQFILGPLDGLSIYEPAVNRGYLLRGLADYAPDLTASDIFDYGAGFPKFDFLSVLSIGGIEALSRAVGRKRFDWVITNPPFKALLDFVLCGLEIADVGVAMLCRTQCLEGNERFERLFRPFAGRWTFAQFVERIPMVEGRCDPKASSATSYGWLVIWKEPRDPQFLLDRRHIPPCRKILEREGDYR